MTKAKLQQNGDIDIDIETRSVVDLSKYGVYRYVEDINFKILNMSYSENGGPVITLDLTKEKIPEELVRKILDSTWRKVAHNAQFERICLSAYIRKEYPKLFKGYGPDDDYTQNYLNPEDWYCTEVLARYHGLPGSLAKVSEELGLEVSKMKEGVDGIRLFCKPQKKPLANGNSFYEPWMKAKEWRTFMQYNGVDVEVELAIKNRLRLESVPNFVWDEYHTDQKINDRGCAVDMQLVNNAYELAEKASARDRNYLRAVTRLENPASNMQMKDYLAQKGYNVDTLSKAVAENLYAKVDNKLKPVIAAYLRIAKTSLKKYYTIQHSVCEDGRVRGCFKFYGAHTGRFSGRLVQLQNLPKNHLSGQELDKARNLVLEGDFDGLSAMGDVADLLTQLIRTAIVPGSHSTKLICADYGQIEPRVLCKLVNLQWKLDAFVNGEDIYCASASRIYGVPVEKHGQNSELRQYGKVAELALGYGGGYDAMLRFGGKTMEDMPKPAVMQIVYKWRNANSRITEFWRLIDKAVVTALKGYEAVVHGIKFRMQDGSLVITLPSGRELFYHDLNMERYLNELYHRFESRIVYKENGILKGTWGGKLCENITQAIARDVLTNAFEGMSAYKIVAHIHDEVIIEVAEEASTEEVCRLMTTVPEWIEGLPLVAEPLEDEVTRYYHK